MIKLNSKTTRGVAAMALLAGSLFATNASAEYMSTGCSVYVSGQSCVSPSQIKVNPYGIFNLETYVNNAYINLGGAGTGTATVQVFKVTGNKIFYQGQISKWGTKQLRDSGEYVGFGNYPTYQVAIIGFRVGSKGDYAGARIYRK